MTLESVMEIMKETGLPVAYRMFKEGEAPQLPFICVVDDQTNNFIADGKVWLEVHSIDIELYTKVKDTDIENKIKKVLNDYEIPWQQSEEYIESEKCYEEIFTVEV